MKKNLIIHVGYPKTATTTLQKSLFNKHSEIEYLNNSIDTKLFKSIIEDSSVSLGLRLKKNIVELFHIINKSEKRVFVLSNEGFTSSAMHFSKVKRYNKTELTLFPDGYTVMRNLGFLRDEIKSIATVKILISIRNQRSLIKSYYAQEYDRFFSNNFETNTFEKFINFSLEHQDNFILKSLDFYNLIEEYKKLFGTDNVSVLVFEDLLKDAHSFYFNLSTNILGVDFNETKQHSLESRWNVKQRKDGYSTDGLRLSKIVIRFINRVKFWPNMGFTETGIFRVLNRIILFKKILKNLEYTETTDKKLFEHFAENNKSLGKTLDRKLDDLGY